MGPGTVPRSPGGCGALGSGVSGRPGCTTSPRRLTVTADDTKSGRAGAVGAPGWFRESGFLRNPGLSAPSAWLSSASWLLSPLRLRERHAPGQARGPSAVGPLCLVPSRKGKPCPDAGAPSTVKGRHRVTCALPAGWGRGPTGQVSPLTQLPGQATRRRRPPAVPAKRTVRMQPVPRQMTPWSCTKTEMQGGHPARRASRGSRLC